MSSSAGRLPGSWLTGFLSVTFILAGCWAMSQESKTSPAPSQAVKPASKAVPGNTKAPAKSAVAEGKKSSTPAAAERPPEPLLKGWETPSVAIVLSGEQIGYLEPCGCSAKQSGGFARRGDLFEQLRAKKWPVAAFDLGGTLKRSRRHD